MLSESSWSYARLTIFHLSVLSCTLLWPSIESPPSRKTGILWDPKHRAYMSRHPTNKLTGSQVYWRSSGATCYSFLEACMKIIIFIILECCLWYCMYRGIKELTQILRLEYHHENLDESNKNKYACKPKQNFCKNDNFFRVVYDFLTLGFRLLRKKW